MAGGDLAGGKTLRAATGAFVCFEDEAGVTGRPPKGCTWGRRGKNPDCGFEASWFIVR